VLLTLALVATSCGGEHAQSVLHPAGPAAEAVADLWWLMLGLGTAVFVAVMVMTVLAITRRSDRPPLGSTPFIVVSGLVVPAAVLVFLLFVALRTTIAVREPATDLTVEVVGHMWWWEVRYPGHDVVTANEVRIPVGRPVRLEVTTADVIHSFWVPQLHGKIDLIPETVNTFWMQADHVGTYRGQCAEFCGLQHARMAFVVVAEPEEVFDAWLARQVQPAVVATTEQAQHGALVFDAAGCATCHVVRGAFEEATEVGPDLTHFGSRLTIGAATRPNTTGDLMGWVANPQAIKPGNRMPPTYLVPADLHALVAYLESLR
jgi:cytochrome c oxidase subunit II